LSLVLACAGMLATAPTAAAATCYESSCVGKNPHTTGCDADAFTVNSVYFDNYQIRVDLRHSRVCNTRWARVTDDDPDPTNTYRLTATRQLWSPYGWYNQRVAWGIIDGIGDYDSYVGWTDMNLNSGDDRHRACSWDVCTDWHV
jgi:hypothetical protein